MDPANLSHPMLPTIRDLANLAALSADWVDGPPGVVAEGLADLLVKTLLLDFAYLRLRRCPADGHELEVARTVDGPATDAQTREIGDALAPWLTRPASSEIRSVSNPLGSGTARFAVVPIGLDGEDGALVAGSRQAGFPAEEDRLFLDVATKHAATALRFWRVDDDRRRLVRERNLLLERQQLQFERMPIACIALDPQLRVTDWNPAAETIFGYRREEVVGKSADMLLVPQSSRRYIHEIKRRLVCGDMIAHSINENVTRDGHIILCEWHNTPLRNADGDVIAILAMAQDITEHTRNAESVKRSEPVLAEFRRVAHIGSWSWDIAVDRLTCSDEHYRILGLSPQAEAMTYDRFLSLVHPDDRSLVQNNVDRSFRDHQLFECCFRTLQEDGAGRIVRSRAQVVRDENDKPIRMFGTVQDITESRRAEEALEQSRQRFQAVFENCLDGIMLIDDVGRYVDVNLAICELLGYSREEFLQMSVWDLTPAVDRERIPELLAQFLSVPRQSGEYGLLNKAGQISHGEYRAVTNILPGVHLAVHRDITERKQVEHALRQSEERFRFVVESIPHMVWAARPDGAGDYHNSRFKNYLGVAPDQLQGDGWAESLHPDDRQRVVDAWEFARRHGDEYRILCRFRESTGEYRWFITHALPQKDVGGQVVRWFGTCTDIDEQKRAEEALRDSEERLRQLVVLMPAAVYTCDGDGRITFYNRRAVEIWGREPCLEDRFCGAFRLWRMDGTVLPLDQAPMACCIREGLSFKDMAIVAEKQNGSRAVVSVNIAPLLDQEGRRIGAINVFQDITDRKRAEEALRDSAVRLQTLSLRVVEVQEEERRHLARELHDEIGQVLSAISANLHAVKNVCAAAAVPRIDESIQLVDQATQQVRTLSLDLRPSMLDDLGLVATLRWYTDRQAQRAGFAVHFTVNTSAVRLPVDRTTACFRVVQEALTNVVRHARAQNVWVELRQGDDEVELTIRDDGVGFDRAIARRGAARGEGFGLLGMHERVELLGGRADIQSRPGGGTSIRVFLPVASAPSSAQSNEKRQPEPGQSAS